jgi:hypothetical protein
VSGAYQGKQARRPTEAGEAIWLGRVVRRSAGAPQRPDVGSQRAGLPYPDLFIQTRPFVGPPSCEGGLAMSSGEAARRPQ